MSNNPYENTNNDDLINAVKKNDLNGVKERIHARRKGILSEIEEEIFQYKIDLERNVRFALAGPWEGEEKEEDNERVFNSIVDSIVRFGVSRARDLLVKFHMRKYLNAMDRDGNTPLSIAESSGYQGIVEFLRDQGATR